MRRSGILVAAFISAILLVGASCAKTASTPQTLRAVLAVEPGQIDPALASAVQEVTVVKQVFRGLMNFDSTLKLKADVAREIPTVANKGVSQDGLTYTFKLRPEVSWSDGKKVVARDFEYGIKRMLSPETASSYASSYFSIAGAEAYNGGKGDAASVGVKALDDVTLQVKLAEPTTTFLQLMALWPAYPVREDIISRFGKKWTDPPNYVGNGPFVLAERVANDHITLKANPNYWANKSKLGEIQVKVIGDGNAMLSAYRNNEVDIAPVLTGNERAVIEDAVLGKEVLRYPALSTFGFIFNNTVAPFDNVKVRRAITTAIDRESFINSVRSGVGKPATSWIPPGMPGFDASLGSQYKFDAAKARQLLAEAGYPDPTKLPPIRFQYAGA
ncbi:MAG: peptide ABC transporter substrate-binding protein, partial [Chloroflexi bacterium]|nr:peptide ABC transporter substrate-binding protein [Chloroflexota bacterium]